MRRSLCAAEPFFLGLSVGDVAVLDSAFGSDLDVECVNRI